MVNKFELKARNINLEYSSKVVLKNISFELKGTELIGIIGPNGAGKSSLLKILSQNLKMSDGAIYLNNKNLHHYNKDELAKIRAFVSPEENVSNNFISVYQYLSFGRSPYQNWFGSLKDKDRNVIEKTIDETGIREFISQDLMKLSSGEKQRVQIARAIVQEPSLLLLDEPTSHLDIRYQLDIMNLLKKISCSGVNVITILHDLNLASYFSNRLMLLSNGEIISFDKPAKVLTEENLEKVFKNKWDIIDNPLTNRPKVYPKFEEKTLHNLENKKLHIIGGGGSASDSMKLLKDIGFDLSVGIVNLMDSDYFAAKELDIRLIQEEPFSPISEKTGKELREHLKSVDYIYLPQLPFGKGNLINLEEVLIAQNLGKVIITEGQDFKDRDFTDGEATVLWNQLTPQYFNLFDFLKKLKE